MSPDSRVTAFPTMLAAMLAAWKERGRLVDLLPALFDGLLGATGAERAVFLGIQADDQYRTRGSRNRDGETVPSPERWVSHFALQGALSGSRPTFYSDTTRDRRYRTEAEIEQGVRTRSILVIPVNAPGMTAAVYLDSRFRAMNPVDVDDPNYGAVRDLLVMALRHEEMVNKQRQLERKLERLETRAAQQPVVTPMPRVRPSRKIDFHGFVTANSQMLSMLEEVERLATSDLSVLIQGESGTGKEVLARAIHQASGRQGPFLSLHCGAIPRSLVEIELFGHARGAFTGADREREGLIEMASGGTVFLDEIGEMATEMQTALLRVLQTGRYRRVSDDVEREADIRVVSSTQEVTADDESIAGIRTDLYYRLAGITARIAPLRSRQEDIQILTDMFLEQHAKSQDIEIGDEVRQAMLDYAWPGNVRELENLIRRVAALGKQVFDLAKFQEITGSTTQPIEAATEMQSVLDRAERDAILRALEQAAGNKSRASKMLGLSRKTFYRRLEKYGIPL